VLLQGDKPPAKTNVVLDVKGWDDETDLVEMEKLVREVSKWEGTRLHVGGGAGRVWLKMC